MIDLEFSQCKTYEDKKKVFDVIEEELETLKTIWLPGGEK